MADLAKVEILRVTGARETHQIRKRDLLGWIRRRIGATTTDTVNLRDADGRLTGQVLIVDDVGMVVGKPVNAAATALYLAQSKPGTTHTICGDVAIAVDEDFG